MKTAREVEARLRILMQTYGVVQERTSPVQVACVQAVTLYWTELWWDPKEVGRQDDLQLLLNPQDRSILGALPTTLQAELLRDSGLTPTPMIFDSRQ